MVEKYLKKKTKYFAILQNLNEKLSNIVSSNYIMSLQWILLSIYQIIINNVDKKKIGKIIL